ncbi:MAG: hypothetical protein KVP17_004049 [Porospora cf. gigantea B]|nr:MAG: hypothetical protein KVP17_004049 [Porospora cf. gigantea B]
MDMKALGCYSCRVLSFKDIVFEMVNVDSSAVFRKQYDDVAAILTAMLHHIRQVFRSLEGERRFQEVMAGSFPESAKWLNQFWGLQQRVFKQLLVTQKVQKVVQLTEDCIRQDKQVVISLWTTGEAALKSLCGEEITDFVAVVKVGMQNMMAKWWATGYPRTFPEEYTDLVRRIENLDLPPNPLDDLILKLGGPSRVAELSGRSVRLVKTANGVSMVCRKAVNCESVNVEEARAFQTGLKRVAIITEAASQGISLHADKSRGPSRVRVMMCLELPWAADKAVQQFGRVHRSNQEFCPEYRLLVSDIGGERRFVACIASRMKMMGAITKGDRRAAFASSNAQLEDGEVNPQGVSLLDFDVYSHHGYQARRILLNYLRFASGATPHPPDFKVPHMKFIKEYGSTSDFANLVMDHMCTFQLDTPDVGHAGSQHMDRFLNRMLLMPVRIQNHLFEVFVSIFNTLVQFALDAGELDLGLEDVNWSHGYYRSATLIGREVLYYDEASELNTVHLCYRLDRGVTWAQAVAALSKTKRRSFEGFYLYYNRGMESTALVLQRKGYFGEESGTRVLIVKPNSGPEVRQGSSVATLEAIMLSSWRKVSEDDFDKAQALWSRCYDMAADICMHRQWGYQCKRAQCSFGMRYIRKCVIAVNLIRLWSKLQEFLQSSVEFFDDDGILQKTQRKLHLAKILDADNNSIVGVQVTHELGTVIREKLNEQEADCEELSIVGTRGHVF